MPTDLLIFADPVKIAIDFLRDQLNGTDELAGGTIGDRVPSTRTDIPTLPLIVVRRIGGTKTIVTDRPRLDVIVWGKTKFTAARLASLAESTLLYRMRDTVQNETPIYDVSSFTGSGEYPDPTDSGTPAFMFTIEFGMRGAKR